MDASTVPTGPVRLTLADEAAHLKQVRENLERGTAEDWPNEAGFDDLTEHCGPIELNVAGQIPAWASGSLYRTGPGVSSVDTPSGPYHLSHWFDGLAHTHRFDIVAPGSDKPSVGAEDKAGTNGIRVFYSSRRQSDLMAESIRKHGTLRTTTFAQRADPCMGLLGKVMSVFRRDNSLTNVGVTLQTDLNIADNLTDGRLFSGAAEKAEKAADVPAELGHRADLKSLHLATDASVLLRVDPDTLEPLGYTSQSALHPDLAGPSSAAHGKRDPVTGDYFNFNLEYGRLATYRVFQLVAATGEVKILATLRGGDVRAGYIHSMFLTENYVVLCINSLLHKLGGATIPLRGNILESLAFQRETPCRWYLVDRRGGRGVVSEFLTPPGFSFHSTNSFEDAETGEVVCELFEYATADVLYSFYYDVLTNRGGEAGRFWRERGGGAAASRLARYRFPTDPAEAARRKGEVILPSMEIPGPHAGELPTYNAAYALRPHRYVYGVGSRGLSTLFDCIVKTDTRTREAVMWSGPVGHTPGEPIFCARPRGGREGVPVGEVEEEGEMAEDDGVLLSVVLDGEARKSYLLCLDARTLEEVGRADCEFAVGFGFHGRLMGAK